MWQQSPSPLVPSSSHASLTQESMSINCKLNPEHMSPNMHDLKNLDHPDLGAPLLSLLSGPPANVSCDPQYLLDPKLVHHSSQVSLTHRTPNGFSAGSRVSEFSSALWPHNVDCPNFMSREVLFPPMSANSTMNGSSGSAILQSAKLNLQKSQPGACQNPHEKDKAKSFSSLIGNNNAGPIPANSWKLQKCAGIAEMQKLPVEFNVAAYHRGHYPSSSLPRVFCSGISGKLLLSDTGLLGVVCACHGLYMSISKFSEHSGSCDFDPGSAVCMDNGETIAQWWKTFFSKSRIRLLEGCRRWDWPEGISAASSLTYHPISEVSTSSVLWNEIGSFGTSVSSVQQPYSVINSKENQSCRNVVDEYAYHEKGRTSQECSNSLFNYYINSSHGNLLHPTDKQIPGVPNPFGKNTQKASHSTTAKLDSFCGSASSFSALPCIQDLKTPFIGYGVGRNTSFIDERPGVISNIELRLGQPPENSQTLEAKVMPAFASNLNGMYEEPPKVLLSDKLLQKSNELKGSTWTLQDADIASNPTERKGPTQLEHISHVGGAYGAITDYTKDSPNGNLMTYLNPPLLSSFQNPETKWQLGSNYDSGNGSHVNESGKSCFPWSSVAGNIKEFHTDVFNGQTHMNKGKKLECAVNGLFGAAKSNVEFSNTFKEDISSPNIVLGMSSSGYDHAFHDKNPNLCQKSNRIADKSSRGDILTNCMKFSSLCDIRHFNHGQITPIQNSLSSKETTSIGFRSKSSLFVQGATPTVSMEGFCGINPGLQNENVKVSALQNMLESSDRHNDPASVRYIQWSEIRKNPCIQSLMTIVPSISKDHLQLLDSSRMPKTPKVGEKSTMPGTMYWMDHTNERFSTMTGRCSSPAGACVPPTLQQFFVRPGGSECNITLSNEEQCSQGLPYASVPEKHISTVQANCLMGKYNSNGDYYCNLGEGARNGAATSAFHSKLNDNHVSLKERTKSLQKTENLVPPNVKSIESHPFQWRDVPKRTVESCSSTRKEKGAGLSSASLGSLVADTFKCFTGCAQHAFPLKEHEVSDISSGCSALDAMQSSIEVNKKDYSTVEGGDMRCENNLVLDEGSGNDRSWSSDDALDGELCAQVSGSASRINLIKRGSLKVIPREPSVSLIEDIRQEDSFKSKYAPHQVKRSSIIQEDCDYPQQFEVGSKKRRKTVKWMKLDVPFSVSGQSSINDESPKCNEEVGQNALSVWDVQMPVEYDQGSPSNCEDSFEQSLKQRNTVYSTNRDLKRVHLEGEQQITEAHKRSEVDDTLETFEMLRKKRLRLDDASATKEGIPELCCSSAELTAKSTSLGGPSNSRGKPDFPKCVARPIIFGKYGVISNGNPSKPIKIIPLGKILKTAASRAKTRDSNVYDNDKHKSISVEVKEKSVRSVKETPLSKRVLRSQVKKVGTHNLPPIESERHDPNEEIETASCSATNGSDLSYTSLKLNNITDIKSGVQLKKKYKEVRKRSLHELLIEGNCFKAVSSCHKELCIKDAVDDRVQKNEMIKTKRCSENHQPENSDMFCCVGQSSDKDECDQLFECTRFLIKGLRNEAVAIDNKTVSFQGRCIPKGDSESFQPGEKFLTCARVEGYKGRKREGFLHNHPHDERGNAGCLVPQEQLNAWLHIHRQKPQRKGRLRLSSSIFESDYRKAYARYKQSKGWKNLVVYKSGIHALGLYTSQFISHGAMVVEYIGEIVGLHVADRREREYHSGKKLQHKSACYFFRIDKEHIIDATRKGGIARFVNHSCQPNCVAKVISVRNEKKVVFFAERDIYPGEEITYDYHFNHEDEGEKIPCYCKSKNCRRYLN